jgi:NitT/TauT family transport system ATP-binding protein
MSVVIEATKSGIVKAPKGAVGVRNLSVTYAHREHVSNVLNSINFKIEPGDFVSLLGPSGCGKTTILNTIAGFIKPVEGYVAVDDQQVIGPGADRGVVFQQYSLLPWKTTFQNVELGLKIKGTPKVERRSIVNDYLDRVGLYAYRNMYPHQLSGGMQQRASIVRALVNSPSVLLMDEPFAALDAQTRQMMQELLIKIWSDLHPTIIFVTHDIDEAIFLSNRVLVMGIRPGRIKADIPINLSGPRGPESRLTNHFTSLKLQIFEIIREETLKGVSEEFKVEMAAN